MADGDAQIKDIVGVGGTVDALSDSDKVMQIFNALPVSLGRVTFRRVLAASILPEANTWTLSRKSAAAGITRDTWYRTVRKPAYREASIALAKEIIGHAASPIAASFIASALSGDSKAQIRALEELGVLKAQSSGGVTVPVHVNIGLNIAELTDTERAKFREDCVAAFSRMRPSNN